MAGFTTIRVLGSPNFDDMAAKSGRLKGLKAEKALAAAAGGGVVYKN